LASDAEVITLHVRVDMDQLDHVLLQAISDILDERVTEAAIAEALCRLRSGEENGLNRRQTIERGLSWMEAHKKNLVQAIVRGDDMTPFLAKLKEEGTRKELLVLELESLIKCGNLNGLSSFPP